MIRVGRLQTSATVLTCAKPAPLARPAPGHLQPGLLPESVHALRVYQTVSGLPAVLAQERGDLPVAKARVPLGKLVDASCQHAVFLRSFDRVALRRTRLPQHSASPPLADAQLLLDVPNGPAAARRA